MTPYRRPTGRQAGFGLIEVLVTLVILTLGLLGLAGTMMQGHRSELESYQRVQALVLLQDMVSRINANRHVASCYAITTDTTAGTPYLGVEASAEPDCDTVGTATQRALALRDLQEWNDLLTGAAEVSGTENVGAMVGARGCVSFNATTGTYLVSVAWQGIGQTAAAPATWNCAKGEYGDDEKLRRVASLTLKIADLD